MERALAIVALLTSCVGCGDDAPPSDSGVPVDAPLPYGVTRSPDGMGYCCVMSEIGGCGGANLRPGGFIATTARGCEEWTDVSASTITPVATDAHGCMYWDWNISNVENCMVPRWDAGQGDAGRVDGGSTDAAAASDAMLDDASTSD